MQFIAQFFDPRPNHRFEFVRLFVVNKNDVEEERSNANLKRFDFTNKDVISIRENSINPVYHSTPKLIIGWLQTYELSSDELYNHLKETCGGDEEVLDDHMDKIKKHFERKGFVYFEGLKNWRYWKFLSRCQFHNGFYSQYLCKRIW